MPLKLVRRPGSDRWYLRGTVRGVPVFESAGTADKALAEAARAKREADLFEEAIYGKRAVVSFRRCALSYLDFEPRDARTEALTLRLIDHFGNLRLAAIDQDAVDQAVTAIAGQDAAPATKIRAVYTPLTAILNHGAARKWCDHPKFGRPSVPQAVTRFLTPAQALALIAGAADHLKPLLMFLVCTGARLSEALDLDWADVDLPAARVRFRESKNGEDRIAALPPAAIADLANLAHRDGRVFLRDDGEPYVDRERLVGGQIRTGWATACKRAGLPGVIAERNRPRIRRGLRPNRREGDIYREPIFRPELTPHDLRHTWASWFYALTKDPLLLKHEGGWRSSEMVERYTHLLPSALIPEIAGVWGASHPRIGVLPANGTGTDCTDSAQPHPAKMLS